MHISSSVSASPIHRNLNSFRESANFRFAEDRSVEKWGEREKGKKWKIRGIKKYAIVSHVTSALDPDRSPPSSACLPREYLIEVHTPCQPREIPGVKSWPHWWQREFCHCLPWDQHFTPHAEWNSSLWVSAKPMSLHCSIGDMSLNILTCYPQGSHRTLQKSMNGSPAVPAEV